MSDWSTPPYYACDCGEKWSIAVLGDEVALAAYRQHTQTEPCKSRIASQRAAYDERTRTRVWTFDHFVGVQRARDLGIWPADDDPTRTWRVPGTVTVHKHDDEGNLALIVEADGVRLTLESFRDQWGTWYTVQSGKGSRIKTLAQEDGTRSFLRALIAGLQHLEAAMDYQTRDPEEVRHALS